jgi:archaeosine synthase
VRFEILERDGLARVGELEIDGVKHRTPVLAFIDTERYPAPNGVLRIEPPSKKGKGDLVIEPSGFSTNHREGAEADLRPAFRGSPYARDRSDEHLSCPTETSSMMLDSEKFVDSVSELKNGDRLLRPMYCSVMGLPHRLALLAYCGYDVFDSMPLIMAAECGSYLTSTGILDYARIKDLPCACPACASENRGKKELLQHNYTEALNELRLVRHTISEGRMRELVESRIRSDPWLVQNLRLMDLDHYDLQELHAPVKGAPFQAGSKESLSRPDIIRWRRRLESRYKKPEGTRVLLLIPCSARKPYSTSQSHRRFRQAIWQSGRADTVHEVIVTSPLGLVPRELELHYPAKDYDIPVTGHWDRDEERMAEEMVSWLVTSQRYDLVISHLGDEREPVNSALKDFVDTSHGSPGSRESLLRLEETLRDLVPAAESSRRHPRELAEMRSICRFQFGEAGEDLCDDARIAGRWPNLKILRGETQLGMLTGDRGMVSLTIEGAKVIADSGAYSVEIEDFIPKGNLFAVGIERASKEIRIGDDVAIAHGKDVRAVGVAQMTPVEMELSKRGEAVRIRHALH